MERRVWSSVEEKEAFFRQLAIQGAGQFALLSHPLDVEEFHRWFDSKASIPEADACDQCTNACTDDACRQFFCHCGQGCGTLMSCTVQFQGQKQTIVYRNGNVGRLDKAAHDGVYLELRCPSDHIFFVDIYIAADAGSVTQEPGEEG